MRLLFCSIVICLACVSNGLLAQANIGLVINELMADNGTAVADEGGDFDDWIELYNNLDIPMDLSGYGLSDDEDDLGKFRIPEGTTIAENGYLIIWADDDQEQGPLHAQFRLSANGESLFLTDPDSNIIDQVIFTEQAEDLALAREPNGTGDFVIKQHSFNGDNDLATSTLAPLPASISFFPNPTKDVLRLELEPIALGTNIQVINLEGKVVLEAKTTSTLMEFDLSPLAAGNYILRIEGYKGIFVQKID